jgi:hypothetical protein
MKGDKVFLDTNLLLYAYDAGSPAKHAVAVRILEDLWKSGNGILSTRILSIRGHRVMLDADLAELYGVPTKRLNEAVRRNAARFPEDFMFQLTAEEAETLRSQFATSNGRGGRRYIPYAFSELGVAMLSSVLNSERAVQVNIAIIQGYF